MLLNWLFPKEKETSHLEQQGEGGDIIFGNGASKIRLPDSLSNIPGSLTLTTGLYDF